MVASLAATSEHRLSSDPLVEGARAYSQEAWGAIYDDNYARIYQYCLRRTGQPAVAEDLAAEVFAEAVRGIHRYQDRGLPILAWLYRIARNLTVSHLRRHPRGATVPLRESDRAASPGPDAAEYLGLRRDIELALARLTPDQREVIQLRFFEGLSHDETAAVMHRRSGAVRVLQSRALSALRGLIGP